MTVTLTPTELGRLLANPRDEAMRNEATDFLIERDGDTPLTDALRRGQLPVTRWEIAAARALTNCTFLPGSSAKRFVCAVCAPVAHRSDLRKKTLSIPQTAYLWSLVRSYRRQIERHYPKDGYVLIDYAFCLGGRPLSERMQREREKARRRQQPEPLWEAMT